MPMPSHSHCPGCATPELAFAPHDHRLCAQDAFQRGEAMVAESGARLTPVRRRVLEILLEAHRALGAYELLNRLVSEGFGNQPPLVYRALDFLEEQGLAHRIQRLNAFAACMHPGEAHVPAFLICRVCHSVAEATAAPVLAALREATAGSGFAVERASIEALGLCPACKPGALL